MLLKKFMVQLQNKQSCTSVTVIKAQGCISQGLLSQPLITSFSHQRCYHLSGTAQLIIALSILGSWNSKRETFSVYTSITIWAWISLQTTDDIWGFFHFKLPKQRLHLQTHYCILYWVFILDRRFLLRFSTGLRTVNCISVWTCCITLYAMQATWNSETRNRLNKQA